MNGSRRFLMTSCKGGTEYGKGFDKEERLVR